MYDPKRRLDFPGLLNARDLGGYPTVDGSRTSWRSLIRSDDLSQLTRDGLEALSRYGIETVVDLRWPDEVTAMPSPVTSEPGGPMGQLKHIRYEPFSLCTPTQDEWRARRADSTAKELWNRAMLEHLRAELRHVLQIIATASDGPLLFHCVAGKDRTGVLAALLLALANVVPDAIAYDYAASFENLCDAYLKRYADGEPAAIIEALQCPEQGVHNMLAYLEQFGGAQGYLEAIGMEHAHIARLRARLRD
jgi:protein-tyrosine phosphatase